MKKFVCLAAVGAMADAKFNACTSAELDIAMKAFFQGMQADATALGTDCYASTTATVERFRAAGNGYYNFNIDSFLDPIYETINAMNSLVEIMVNCQTTNLTKQFNTRLTTWSGALDLTATIGVSFLKNWVYEKNGGGNGEPSKLYNAASDFFNSDSCAITSRALGQMFHEAVFFEIADVNYEDLLLTNITED